MVLDSSAAIAIILGEPEAAAIESAIEQNPECTMSAASVLECEIVLRKRIGDAGPAKLDRLIAELPIVVRGFDLTQLAWARLAFEKFGRGRHPAALNVGDCFAYALARVSGEPLLYKGGDF